MRIINGMKYPKTVAELIYLGSAILFLQRFIMNKEKQERFYKVAESRTNKIINDIRLLAKCSKTSCYEYREAQVKRIFKMLQEELDKAKELFKNKGRERVLGDYCLSPEPYTDLHLPNGDMLRAIAYDDPDFPTISIQLFEGDNDPVTVCFAEFNPERESGPHLCIGAYNSEVEDTVYYEQYHPDIKEE